MKTLQERKELVSIIYGGLLALCLILGTKVVDLGPFAFDGSQLPYALLLCCVGIVTEVEGRKSASALILKGLFFQAIAFSMIMLTLSLPVSEKMDPERARAFELLVGQNLRMIVAGFVSYLTVTYVISRLQSAMARKNYLTVGKRSAISNVIGQACDTLIYLSIAFYGIFPLIPLMTGQFLVKSVISISIVPIVVRLGTEWLRGTGEIKA